MNRSIQGNDYVNAGGSFARDIKRVKVEDKHDR